MLRPDLEPELRAELKMSKELPRLEDSARGRFLLKCIPPCVRVSAKDGNCTRHNYLISRVGPGKLAKEIPQEQLFQDFLNVS